MLYSQGSMPIFSANPTQNNLTSPNAQMPNITSTSSGQSQVGGALSNFFSRKNKGGPHQPAQMSTAATPGFNQPMAPDARSALLQIMMQRSRGGVVPPISTPSAVTTPSGY